MQRRQSQLAIAFDPLWRRQSAWDVPIPEANLTKSFPATSRNYIDVDETTEDVDDCTGQDLLFELITGQVARLTIDMDVDPDVLGGATAFAYGASASPSGGTNQVNRLDLTGVTGGTYQLGIQTGANLQVTTPLAWNANEAAINAALTALSNLAAGDLTAEDAASPLIDLTAGNNLAATLLEPMELYNDALVGALGELSVITPGVGLSHPISRMVGYQGPLMTLYVGFRDSDKDPVIFKNVVVNVLRVRATHRSKVTATLELIGSADLQPAVDFIMPECMDIVPVRFGDCAMLVNGVDQIAAGLGREFEYYYQNDIKTGPYAFLSQGIDVGRLEREDKRPSGFNFFIFGEPGDPLYNKATQRPRRAIVSAALRVGPVGRNCQYNVPQGILKTGTPRIRFDEGESQIALVVRPRKISGDNTTPSNALAVTSQPTAYLIAA